MQLEQVICLGKLTSSCSNARSTKQCRQRIEVPLPREEASSANVDEMLHLEEQRVLQIGLPKTRSLSAISLPLLFNRAPRPANNNYSQYIIVYNIMGVSIIRRGGGVGVILWGGDYINPETCAWLIAMSRPELGRVD